MVVNCGGDSTESDRLDAAGLDAGLDDAGLDAAMGLDASLTCGDDGFCSSACSNDSDCPEPELGRRILIPGPITPLLTAIEGDANHLFFLVTNRDEDDPNFPQAGSDTPVFASRNFQTNATIVHRFPVRQWPLRSVEMAIASDGLHVVFVGRELVEHWITTNAGESWDPAPLPEVSGFSPNCVLESSVIAGLWAACTTEDSIIVQSWDESAQGWTEEFRDTTPFDLSPISMYVSSVPIVIGSESLTGNSVVVSPIGGVWQSTVLSDREGSLPIRPVVGVDANGETLIFAKAAKRDERWIYEGVSSSPELVWSGRIEPSGFSGPVYWVGTTGKYSHWTSNGANLRWDGTSLSVHNRLDWSEQRLRNRSIILGTRRYDVFFPTEDNGYFLDIVDTNTF